MNVEEIRAALSEGLGLAISAIRPLAAGDINETFRAQTPSGPIFVKSSAAAQRGVFADEAAGLEWLRVENGVRLPQVIGVLDGETTPRLLALGWIERSELDAAGEEELGRGLAHIHMAGAPAFGASPAPQGGGYGQSPMRFNELSLPNDPRDTWAEFYAENRLLPLAREAQRRGKLGNADVSLIERVASRMTELAGPAEPPARIHGDLWSGNVIAGRDGRPYLIDPVAHGGHREVDLALLRLFGGPSERCLDAYDEVYPRAEGHREREALWQLAMILLHVYLFGGAYAQQARELAGRYS